MKITRTHILSNELMEHLGKVLLNLFKSGPLCLKLEYFLGEDEQGKRLVCFIVSSEIAGIVYEKYQSLLDHETVADLEEEFCSYILDDLLLAGVGFLQTEKIRYNNLERQDGKIVETKVIYLN